MSGIETAGHVVGVIPTIISALEVYESISKAPLQDLIEIQILRFELLMQQANLTNTISQLLRTATNWAVHDINDLLINNDNSAWKDPDLNSQIKAYLGDDYNVTTASFNNIWAALEATSKSITFLSKTRFDTPDPTDARPIQLSGLRRLRWVLHVRKKTRAHIKILGDSTNNLINILHNINRSRDAAVEIQDIVSTFAEISSLGSINNEVASILSGRTENEDREPILSFLSISIATAETVRGETSEDALLDSGATKCCISEELARHLQVTPVVAEEEQLWTAVRQEMMFHSGKTKLKIRWKDTSGDSKTSKMWFYVVPGLHVPAILSHQFIENHPEVWTVAEHGNAVLERIATIGFSRRDRKKKQDDAQFLHDRVEENKRNDQEATLRQLEEMKERFNKNSEVTATSSTSRISQSTGNESGTYSSS